MLSFEEFTNALYKAGWNADCDAQHRNIICVYDAMVSESLKANELTRLRAENEALKKDAERLDFMADTEAQINWLEGGVTRYRLVWPLTDEVQVEWFPTARAAIDAAMERKK